jgi:hypothetical protein
MIIIIMQLMRKSTISDALGDRVIVRPWRVYNTEDGENASYTSLSHRSARFEYGRTDEQFSVVFPHGSIMSE